MNYRQESAKEQRIQGMIVGQLKYSFNNNMASIQRVYEYLSGSTRNFSAFWKASGGEEIAYQQVERYKLYDADVIWNVFRKNDAFRNFIDRNRIRDWEELAYRADEKKNDSK